MDKDYYRKLTLALSRTKGIGNVVFRKLMEEADWDVEKLSDKEFVGGLSKKLRGLLNSSVAEETFPLLQKQLTKHNIQYKCLWEDDYPDLLKQTYDPPMVLYYIGSWSEEILKRCITIVGTRKVTDYGKKVTKQLAYDLSKSGFTIVSGMAMGVDRLAHEGALAANGQTVAVLASSPNTPTPTSNADIYKEIIEAGGLVISEYAPDVKIKPGFFASRNRIVAGLSKTTVVTEADEKSGSLITANLAFDSDRDVFAVPGNIDRKFSSGCNLLIREGKAKLVAKAEDILLEYGLDTNVKEERTLATVVLKGEQKIIYEQLMREPLSVDELSRQTKLELPEVVMCCSEMEIEGVVSKTRGGKYQLT